MLLRSGFRPGGGRKERRRRRPGGGGGVSKTPHAARTVVGKHRQAKSSEGSRSRQSNAEAGSSKANAHREGDKK
jgi:hypothetical protein